MISQVEMKLILKNPQHAVLLDVDRGFLYIQSLGEDYEDEEQMREAMIHWIYCILKHRPQDLLIEFTDLTTLTNTYTTRLLFFRHMVPKVLRANIKRVALVAHDASKAEIQQNFHREMEKNAKTNLACFSETSQAMGWLEKI